MVSKDRWSLVTGSFTLKCVILCQRVVVLQDRWSLMAVVSHNRCFKDCCFKDCCFMVALVFN